MLRASAKSASRATPRRGASAASCSRPGVPQRDRLRIEPRQGDRGDAVEDFVVMLMSSLVGESERVGHAAADLFDDVNCPCAGLGAAARRRPQASCKLSALICERTMSSKDIAFVRGLSLPARLAAHAMANVRQSLIAGNVSNANTPGFQAQGPAAVRLGARRRRSMTMAADQSRPYRADRERAQSPQTRPTRIPPTPRSPEFGESRKRDDQTRRSQSRLHPRPTRSRRSSTR